MSSLGQLGQRLYQGDVSIDFVGRRKTWYIVSLAILVVCVATLLIRGLHFGIEFRGGVEFNAQVANPATKVEAVTDAVVDTEIDAAASPTVVQSGTDAIRVQTEPLTIDETQVVEQAILDAGATEANPSSIGPTWGEAIADRALLGLVVFLILVVIFIWAYFREWRMSVAAVVALAHDVIITVGVYSLTGFEVTPASVTGILTILGYSLYDTVVVFDKVRENTRGILQSTRRTYAEGANLAVNQTLVRSINTSVAALLPVGAILYVGAFQLGSGPLKDLALALFVGMAAGAYSSIFIATPLLAQLKDREPEIQAQAKRVAARRTQARKEAGRAVAPTPVSVDGGVAVGAAPRSSTRAMSTRTSTGSSSRQYVPRPATESPPQQSAPESTSTESPSTQSPRQPSPQRPTPRPVSGATASRVQPQRKARSKRGKRK